MHNIIDSSCEIHPVCIHFMLSALCLLNKSKLAKDMSLGQAAAKSKEHIASLLCALYLTKSDTTICYLYVKELACRQE